MKRIALLILLALASSIYAPAQQWMLVKTAVADSPAGNMPGLAAAGKDALLWAPLVRNNFIYGSDVMGDYTLAEYDTAGVAGASINITGKVNLIQAQCDANGNYYVLGTYYDTARFSGGFQSTRNPVGTEPNYFIFRLDKNTLALNWFRLLGADYYSYANSFTIKNGSLYLFIDSAGYSNTLYKYDLATGSRTQVLVQTGAGTVTSVQVDDNGNVYVAGGGVTLISLNFNGHTVVPPPSFTYPAYIVRYKADGTYDWVKMMSDVTIVQRQLSLANNNSLYYSGTVNDSFSIDGFHVHHPAWVYDYLVAMIDSTGSMHWLRQLQDTLSGDAQLRNNYHAITNNDGSLSVATSIRDNINWGNGITSNCGNNGAATVVNYALTGEANWAISVKGLYSVEGHLATDGINTWITGSGYDSTALRFGTISIPTSLYSAKSFLAKINPHAPGTTKAGLVTAPLSVNTFPNPATNSLYIHCASAGCTDISLVDLAGKVVFHKYNTARVINEAINVAAYPRGVYFVVVTAGGEQFTGKVVLE